ncbi:hypothetical protein L596_015452 [Steinernema carpocapsae]|uniref:C2H2-type domain-containing protein n=1 Tax=Steinernema carpocapsae TaxID=34508 RepID=A0A4U5NF73_STECR|nr:hypothetical protein L596_015452 [Steinernema carpocapsae]
MCPKIHHRLMSGRSPSISSELPSEVKYICMQCGEQISGFRSVAQHKALHHGTTAEEENAINTLVAISQMSTLKPPETENPTPEAPVSPPIKEENELPAVGPLRVRRPSARLAASKPRRSPNLAQFRASALTCTQCGRQFQNKCKLTRHIMDHKIATHPYRCPYKDCLQSYDNKNKFKSHLLRLHRDLSAAEFTRLLDQGDKESERLRKLEEKTGNQLRAGTNLDGILQSTLDRMIMGASLDISALKEGTLKEDVNVDLDKTN